MKVHSRGWTIAAVLALTFASSAVSTRADSLCQRDGLIEQSVPQQVIHWDDFRHFESDDRLNATKSPELQPWFTMTQIKGHDQINVHGFRVSGPDTVTQNPEPATMVLLGTGLAGLGAIMRKRRNRKSTR